MTSARRPRVVHLLPCLYLGGAEQHVLRLIQGMSDGYDFALVAPDGPGDVLFDAQGVPRRKFRRLEPDVLTGWSSVRAALAAEAAVARVDVVHVHLETGLLWFARKLLPQAARVYTAHGIVHMEAMKYFLTSRTVNRWADLVCTVSQHDLDKFASWGTDAEKLRLLGNGVATPVATEAGTREMAERLGVEPGRHVVIGSLSRLEQEKGLDLLIRAVAGIAPQLPHIRLMIAGSGHHEARLRSLIDALGVADQVKLIGFTASVGDFLGCLDVYVQPSRVEAFGLAVTEAMAMGVPQVVTRVGGLPEQVVDGETGFVVPPEDVEALAAALRRLAAEPALRGEMRSAARKRHAERFSLDRLFGSMDTVYREAIGIAAQRNV